MRAIVLVGGFGTRLRPLTLTRPKQMLPVVGVTMFERVIAALGRHGVDEAVVSLGYQPDRFIQAFPDNECAGVRLTYATEPEPLDTAGAIAFAAREAGIAETFLAVNGDVLTDLDYAWLVDQHRRFGAEGTLHLTSVHDPSRFGVVPTDDAGRVEQFVEKPPAGTEPTNEINAGSYVLEPSFIDRVGPGERLSIERVVFPAMATDRSLYAIGTDHYWLDAGTPEAYLQANLDLITGRRGHAEPGVASQGVHHGAHIDHSVIDVDVVVEDGATVRRSVVMSGAIIRAGARIEDSIVGARAVVGATASVTDHAMVGDDAEVEDGMDVAGRSVPDPSTWQV